MIKFEVTGATPEEFAENAMKAWGLLAIGLQQALSVRAPEQASPSGSPPKSLEMSATSGSEISSTASRGISGPTVQMTTASAQRMAEAPAAAPAPSVHSDKVDDLFVEEASAKPTRTAKKNSSKGPKLDDLKTRLSEVIVAGTERWGQKRANAYARKLLKEVCAEKIGDIKHEEYADFLELSEAYLSGTAAEMA